MRLKHLTIQGFKTFVPKTDLVFGEGLTAIVGPNGSGKSNVADAVRWVLGEQSLSQLRAKKTEDLIFAGSSTRTPLGMAEVSITIDNADRLLPIEFGEVVLTRRAYRSGDNEYYINKSRVRLRDVLDVASSLGQAYTVVGQGLVDAALSLRPEERRELFEEAAAIRGYFLQREDALRRLARTEENVARVHDLASELEPQVRRLERQARQSQEYSRVEHELYDAMALWYRERWTQAVASLRVAQTAEVDADRATGERRHSLAECNGHLGEARSAVRMLAERVSSLHEQRAQDQARHASHLQTHAVLSERLSAARSQLKALEADRAAVKSSAEAIGAQVSGVAAEVAAREVAASELMETARGLSALLAERDKAIVEASRRRSEIVRQLDDHRKKTADLEGRLEELVRRKAERERAAAEADHVIGASEASISSAQEELDTRHEALLEAQKTLSDAEGELSARQSSAIRSRDHASGAQVARREAARKVETAATQVAALAGEQQSSLHSGVRAVVAAMNSGKIEGLVGRVAELLRVPDEYEVAVEAALGGRLQDVVVEKWAHAEAAIALLKQTGAGRATFLPLDTLRVSRMPKPPRSRGIVGVAADLIDCSAGLEVLAGMLLGKLLIVEDLQAARDALRNIADNSSWTLVTLGGDVVRPGGSVTGGSDVRGGDRRATSRSLLGRERKLREVRAEHDRVVVEARSADADLHVAEQAQRAAELALAHASAAVEERRKVLAAAQLAHAEQQNVLARLSQEFAWRSGLLAEARSQIYALGAEADTVRASLRAAAGNRAPLETKAHELRAEVERLRAEREEFARGVTEGQTRLAVLQEAIRSAHARERDLAEDAQRLRERDSQMADRILRLSAEIASTERELRTEAEAVAATAERLAELDSGLAPSEQAVRNAEAEISSLEVEQSTLQSVLLDAETTHSRASVERQRCAGVLDSLRVEIMEEMAHTSGDHFATAPNTHTEHEAGGHPFDWPLPDASYENIPDATGEVLSLQERERRVYALKAKLARLGPVNPLATEEHRELAARHDYLQTQLVDLVAAAESLKRVIAELDRTMHSQFAETFVQVNAAFEHFFVTLFGGGHARLELTNPDDIATSGVEIFARAPGKRLQPLAALSGGERALTSAALLFALLRVRPVPFCVLDEVDAALDESNVTRFRAALQDLGENTQFVVITHNRGTIEAADTLYGVSMAGDGTSKILSLQVQVDSVA